jgi:hypothetical protein
MQGSLFEGHTCCCTAVYSARRTGSWQGRAHGARYPQSPPVHALHTDTALLICRERRLRAALSLVLHRTDDAHRRVLYRRSRQSRLHLNLFIKNGERVSLRGAPKAPRIYRAAALPSFWANCLQRSDNGGHCIAVSLRSLLARDSFFLRVIIGSGALPPPLSPARNPTSPPN